MVLLLNTAVPANGPVASLPFLTAIPDHPPLIKNHVTHHRKGPGQTHPLESITKTSGCPSATNIHPPRPAMTSPFFAVAQPHMAWESAPPVSAVTNTTSANAKRQSYGMVPRASREETNKGIWSVAKVWPSVSIGSFHGDVSQPPTPKIIDARAAGKAIMVPNSALAEKRTKSITTYKAAAWSKELSKHNLAKKYPDLVEGITHGFHLGIPSITQTYTPCNHMSISLHREAYIENVTKEFQSGRYFGPYSRSEVEASIGPFQSSPLTLLPKTDKPGKFQAIHNFSHPHNPTTQPSINSCINASDYPCTWGTFETVCLVIARLPPGSQASVRDVATAYRTIPTHQSQWPGLVVRLEGNDNYAINTHNNFGLTSAGGVYGCLADAGADIFRANGIGPLSKWVDDHIFFHIQSDNLKSYNTNRARWKSGNRVAKFMLVVEYGFTVRPCQMASMRNLMKIVQLICKIFQKLQGALLLTANTATAMMISIIYLTALVSNGNRPKLCCSVSRYPTLASPGTSTNAQSRSLTGRRPNTWLLLKSGKEGPPTPSSKFNNFMENYYMSHWWSLLDGLTLPTSRPCWASSMTVYSFHAHLPNTPLMTLNGGNSSFGSQSLHDQYHNQHPSSTSEHILTPALVSASLSRLESTGVDTPPVRLPTEIALSTKSTVQARLSTSIGVRNHPLSIVYELSNCRSLD